MTWIPEPPGSAADPMLSDEGMLLIAIDTPQTVQPGEVANFTLNMFPGSDFPIDPNACGVLNDGRAARIVGRIDGQKQGERTVCVFSRDLQGTNIEFSFETSNLDFGTHYVEWFFEYGNTAEVMFEESYPAGNTPSTVTLPLLVTEGGNGGCEPGDCPAGYVCENGACVAEDNGNGGGIIPDGNTIPLLILLGGAAYAVSKRGDD